MASQIIATTTKLTRSYCHTPGQRRFCGKTLGQLFDLTSDCYPDREAITGYRKNGSVKRFTFKELRRQVDGLASGLMELGLRRGERLGLLVGRRYEYVVGYLGAVKAGLVCVRLDTSLKSGDLAKQINKTNCAVLVVDNDCLSNIAELVPGVEEACSLYSSQFLPSVRCLISVDSTEKTGAWLAFRDLILVPSADSNLETVQMEVQPDDYAVIILTSGSTGDSKAVVHSHHGLVESFICQYTILAQLQGGETASYLACVPCFFVSFDIMVAAMVAGGDRLVMTESADVTIVMSLLEAERCTSLILYPSHAFHIANMEQKRDFSSMKSAIIGGNLLPEGTLKKLRHVMAPNIQYIYGITEALLVTYHLESDPIDDKWTTVGRPVPHSEIKIVDEEFRIVPINTEGEICIRGANVFSHYMGDDEKTRAAKTESGWYITGDVGIMLEDGRLRVLGRKDDCIMKNTRKIYPVELERHVIGHSKVQFCHAVAVPDEKMINEICLCVILRQNEECTREELIALLKEKVDVFILPKYVLFFDSFPKTNSGKTKRGELAKMASDRLKME